MKVTWFIIRVKYFFSLSSLSRQSGNLTQKYSVWSMCMGFQTLGLGLWPESWSVKLSTAIYRILAQMEQSLGRREKSVKKLRSNFAKENFE